MKTAKELYPDYIDSDYGPCQYDPIIHEIGNVLIQVDDTDYNGDSRILYEKEGKYGYLIFGWGSCSGCDSLQACSNINEVQSLMNELADSVKWFNSLEELQSYFSQKDWELEYSWHAEETKDFIRKVLDYKTA